jgi:hypothetical protein
VRAPLFRPVAHHSRDGFIHRRIPLTTENAGAGGSGPVEISVVVGSVESERSIRDHFDSILTSARG